MFVRPCLSSFTNDTKVYSTVRITTRLQMQFAFILCRRMFLHACKILVFVLQAMIAVLSAGASAAAAIVYLAHKGNASANWVAICQQYENFCGRITGSLIGSFGVLLIFLLVIPLSGFILSMRH